MSVTTKLQTTSLAVTCKSKDEARKLLEAYSPAQQATVYKNSTDSVMGDYPTLAKIRTEYGEQVAYDWVAIELNDFQNFTGVAEDRKAPYEVIKETSRMICNRFFFLKLTELMLFFQRLKYGDYGPMFGRVESSRILIALKAFVDDRNIIIDAEQANRQREKEDRDKQCAMSREEYERQKAACEI